MFGIVIASEAKQSHMKNKQYYVYIATNKLNTVFYTGITNNIDRRMYEHTNKINQGFTSKYNVNKLVFYETFNTPEEAIEFEKKIKGGSRMKKTTLIESQNKEYRDLLAE